MPTNTEIDAFLEQAPIFLQAWWLEAVAPGQWEYLLVRSKGALTAAMPVSKKLLFGWTFIDPPKETPFIGPWLKITSQLPAKKFAEEKRLLLELIAALPRFGSFKQAFHPGITNWLPFYWQGFQQTTHYTYLFDNTDKLETIWAGMRENIRREINKARRDLRVEESTDFSAVMEMHKLTWHRQSIDFAPREHVMFAVHEACKRRGCCRSYVARGRDGKMHAAAYFIWDATTLYYYISGADSRLRNSGAGSLLVWKGIELASRLGKKFDFEGSMHKPIERFFRAFGARQTPYFVISKNSTSAVPFLVQLIRRLKSQLKARQQSL